MIFVFDSSPLSALFKNFYRSIFGSLWDDFDTLVEEGRLVSTREVLREIEDGPVEGLREWYSKAKRASRADVHVVAIKQVKKPKGAKPGLVYVTGGKSIHLRREEKRLERLLASRLEQ